jgi:hypothetical protein
MKNENVYNLLIIFSIFYFFKKILSIAVETKFPTYNDLANASEFWKTLIKIRTINVVITFIWLSYFLYNYALNFFIRTIFYTIMLHNIYYFLIDEHVIFKIIKNPSEKTREYVYLLNTYGDSIENWIVATFAFYALIAIFSKPK